MSERGVTNRRMFICRDCGESAIGLVKDITAKGATGIGTIEPPYGWEFITTLGVSRPVCGKCLVLVRDDALCGCGA